MLELQLVKGSLFENALEAILDLANVANVDCSSKGFLLQAVDTEHVAVISLLLPSKVFQLYGCDEDRSMGISIADMVKVLRCADNDDIITIKADHENFDDITLTFESPNKDNATTYDLRFVNTNIHCFQIPDWQDLVLKYQAIVYMPSASLCVSASASAASAKMLSSR